LPRKDYECLQQMEFRTDVVAFDDDN